MADWLGSYSVTELIGWLSSSLDASWLYDFITAC